MVGRLSDEMVGEILAADRIVIATPVCNYNVPADLKAWVDHVVRKGLTLGFDGAGLVVGKTATVLLAQAAPIPRACRSATATLQPGICASS